MGRLGIWRYSSFGGASLWLCVCLWGRLDVGVVLGFSRYVVDFFSLYLLYIIFSYSRVSVSRNPPASIAHGLVASSKPNFGVSAIACSGVPTRCTQGVLSLRRPASIMASGDGHSFEIGRLFRVEGTGSRLLSVADCSTGAICSLALRICMRNNSRCIPVTCLSSVPKFSRFRFGPSLVGKGFVCGGSGNISALSLSDLGRGEVGFHLLDSSGRFRVLSGVSTR